MTWAKERGEKNSSKSNRTRALPRLSILQSSREKFELARREHKGKEGNGHGDENFSEKRNRTGKRIQHENDDEKNKPGRKCQTRN
jgi:hypothetical protein